MSNRITFTDLELRVLSTLVEKERTSYHGSTVTEQVGTDYLQNLVDKITEHIGTDITITSRPLKRSESKEDK